MVRDIAIIHFNTPELTRATIESVRKHTPGCRFTVFDNSDKRPFAPMSGVKVLDNTKGQIIDFDAMLARYPKRRSTMYYHASAKHIACVDYLFDVLTEGFVLLDSDVLVKADISRFFDSSVPWTGSVEQPDESYKTVRLAPYLLWINVPMCRQHGIRFLSEGRIYKMSHQGPPYYDTGASFYEDCEKAGLKGRSLNIYNYIVHFAGGSYKRTQADALAWLDAHADLWRSSKYLVVIPYLPSGAQGRELEYAIEGWRRHFKEDHIIVVVGEGLPALDAEDVMCLESKRVAAVSGQYRQHLDYVKCFRAVRDAFPDSEGFIFVADDCYAVNDFDISDVKFLKMLEPDFNFDPNSKNAWRRDKMKTKKALLAAGLPARNFTTHLPHWFDWDKIEALWEQYAMDRESYVIEDLYYNTYYKDRIPFRLNADTDNLKCAAYERTQQCFDRIAKAPSQKIWITNSPDGWCAELNKFLKNYYGI